MGDERECYKCKYYLLSGLSQFCENENADAIIRKNGMTLYLNREHSSKPIDPMWAYAGCMNQSKACHWYRPKNIFKRIIYMLQGNDVGGDMEMAIPKWALTRKTRRCRY